MNFSKNHPDSALTILVECENRWRVYRRLLELGIPCWCTGYQPLQVQIESPLAIAQLWSVVKQVTMPRQHLVDWLEACRKQSAYNSPE